MQFPLTAEAPPMLPCEEHLRPYIKTTYSNLQLFSTFWLRYVDA